MARRPTTANLLLSLGGVVLGFAGLAMVTLGSLSANETGLARALGDCTTSTDALDGEEAAFLTLINNYRAANGLGPLTVSNSLNRAAAWMVHDLGTNNYFAHTDSLGRSPSERAQDCGYPSGAGENLAAGTVWDSAQEAFDAWQSSPGHNANMLGPSYLVIGIAREQVSGSEYGWYWATSFGNVNDSGAPPPPTATPTAVPSTATSTPTQPPAPTATATPAGPPAPPPTATPPPPTATPTTVIPPTATPTPTPTSPPAAPTSTPTNAPATPTSRQRSHRATAVPARCSTSARAPTSPPGLERHRTGRCAEQRERADRRGLWLRPGNEALAPLRPQPPGLRQRPDDAAPRRRLLVHYPGVGSAPDHAVGAPKEIRYRRGSSPRPGPSAPQLRRTR